MINDVAALRLQMLENGYVPLPAHGKAVFLEGWTEANPTPEEIARWSAEHADWSNTGMLTGNVTVFDIDIADPGAAEVAEGMVRERFDGYGEVLVRIGLSPKRAIPLRCEQPFPKIVIRLKAPNNTLHKIEILGVGQQAIVAGIHPETKKPYMWHNGRSPAIVPRSALPEADADEAWTLAKRIAAKLCMDYGYEDVTDARPVDASGGDYSPVGPTDGPLDVDTLLAELPPDGSVVQDVQRRAVLSLLQRGEHPDDIVTRIVDSTMAMAERTRLGWTREREVEEVHGRIRSGLSKLHSEYDHTTGVIPPWLPGAFHNEWTDALLKNKRPRLCRNGGGYHVRSFGSGDEAATPDAPAAETDALPRKKRRELTLRPFAVIDEAKIPPRAWLYGKHYQRGTVSLTAAPGGTGKSSMELVEAIALATARNLLGEQPAERARWLHNGEDPREEIERRIVAICRHYNIPQEELVGWLWVTTAADFPLRVASGYSKLDINAVLVQRITDEIAQNQIDVAIFDPLVTLHSVSEMDPGKMDGVIRVFAGIATDADCAIELDHHMRKPAAGVGADFDIHDIRGAAATVDAVRAARVLNRMSEKDAEDLGCSPAERLARFRVDRAKGNYSAAREATWGQFVNVTLTNGDDVGVVAPWAHPGHGGEPSEAQAAAAKKARDLFMELLYKYRAEGRPVGPGVTSPYYAPKVFAADAQAKAAKVSRAAFSVAMRELLDGGRIAWGSKEGGRGREGRRETVEPVE